jgi:hypothetical protein
MKISSLILIFIIFTVSSGFSAEEKKNSPRDLYLPVDAATICPECGQTATPFGKVAAAGAWFHIARPNLPQDLTSKVPNLKNRIPVIDNETADKLVTEIKKKYANLKFAKDLISKTFPGPSIKQFETIKAQTKKITEENKKANRTYFNIRYKKILATEKPQDLIQYGYPLDIWIIDVWCKELENYCREKTKEKNKQYLNTKILEKDMIRYSWIFFRSQMQIMIRKQMQKHISSVIQPYMSKHMPLKFAEFEEKLRAKLNRPLADEESAILRRYMQAKTQQKMRDKISKTLINIMPNIMHKYVGPLVRRMENVGIKKHIKKHYPE